jgi:hypothetical protein
LATSGARVICYLPSTIILAWLVPLGVTDTPSLEYGQPVHPNVPEALEKIYEFTLLTPGAATVIVPVGLGVVAYCFAPFHIGTGVSAPATQYAVAADAACAPDAAITT